MAEDNTQQRLRYRREIYRNDVEKLSGWMDDEKVIRYLNESHEVSRQLDRISQVSPLPVYSHLFNREGSFFLITLTRCGPIGFLRLIPKSGERAEIVVVIGERSQWGQGYGKRAVRKGLRQAFYQWRKDEVIAKIDPENQPSCALFEKVGFSEVASSKNYKHYTITCEEFS